MKRYRTIVECSKCKDFIWSTYEGEFKMCHCGEHFVDETRWYCRVGGIKAKLTNEKIEVGKKDKYNDWNSKKE